MKTSLAWKLYKFYFVMNVHVQDEVVGYLISRMSDPNKLRVLNAIDDVNVLLNKEIRKHHSWKTWWAYLNSFEYQSELSKSVHQVACGLQKKPHLSVVR